MIPLTRERIEELYTRAFPDTFAEWASGGKFSPFDYQRFIARKIAYAVAKGNGRLIVNLPSRHGKSHLCSIWTPIWFLDNMPRKNVILASYGAELAQKWGREVRNEFEHNPRLLTKLRDDSTAANRWNTPEGGGMIAIGVGGAALGFGADCLTGETLVTTDRGNIRISEIYSSETATRVLSWDHDKKRTVWCRVIAKRRVRATSIISINTGTGKWLRCTPDHRIYVAGEGYQAATKIRQGASLRVLRNKQDARHTMCDVLPREAQKPAIHSAMCLLRHGIQSAISPKGESGEKRIQGHLLQFQVLLRSSRNQELPEVRSVRVSGSEENSPLLRGLQGKTKIKDQDRARQKLPDLRHSVFAAKLPNAILQSDLREHQSRNSDEGNGEFAFQGSIVPGAHISENAGIDSCSGQKYLCDMPRSEPTGEGIGPIEDCFPFAYSPHRSKSLEQRAGQSDFVVQAVPQDAPCESRRGWTDTVSSVERVGGCSEYVYDIQVEGCRNFFANGILVHNCCIIDDPVKDWNEANNPTFRNRVIEWFGSTLYSRIEPRGTIVLLMQRFHPEDLSGWLMENHSDNWEVVSLPAIAEEGDAMGRAPGQALCPQRYDETALAAIKNGMTLGAWDAMFQQRPGEHGTGRAYANFSQARNEDKTLVIRDDLPLQLAFDFNVTPGLHVELCQYDKLVDLFTVIHEIHGPRMKTPAAMDAIKNLMTKLGKKPVEFHIFGDRSGKTESTTTTITDYHIICDKIRSWEWGPKAIMRVPPANPPVRERLMTVNDALLDSEGVPHVKIHPVNCPRLIEDMRRVREDEDGLIDKSNENLTHCADAFGYLVVSQRKLHKMERKSSPIFTMPAGQGYQPTRR